jgi:nucleoside-diphosphate-sugar epimerase
VVAVTGAAGPLGEPAVGALVASTRVRRVVAIDAARATPCGDRVTWRVADVRDPALAARLRGCDVVVHLALDLAVGSPPVERRALNVAGTSVVLRSAVAAGVRRVVVVTGATVYGAGPAAGEPTPIPDGAPVRADQDDSLVGDLVEIERLANRAADELEVVVLRPAALVGPRVDSVVTRHFEAPRLLVLKGSMPVWQFCHVDDLASAVVLAALGDVCGAVNVAADGWLGQRDVERVSGLGRIELPSSVAIAAAERLHRVGVTPATPADLEYLVRPRVVATDALRAAGWRPTWTNADAVTALADAATRHTALVARRLGRGDAARAATCATLAVVGTAAMLRRARRRRRS